MSELTLEQQVARLTAIEDIKQMKARYCGYADDGYDPEGLASLFVEAVSGTAANSAALSAARRSRNSLAAFRAISSSPAIW